MQKKIEVFKSNDGGVVIEKAADSIKPTEKIIVQKNAEAENTKKEISNLELLETAFSYQATGMEILGEAVQNKCVFCGGKTSYSNRYVCPDCWKERKHDILSTLKKQIGNSKSELK